MDRDDVGDGLGILAGLAGIGFAVSEQQVVAGGFAVALIVSTLRARRFRTDSG